MLKDKDTNEAGATASAAAESEPEPRRKKRRPFFTNLMVAGFTMALTLAASWYIQPRMVKAREDMAKWQTLLWLARMPSEKREQLFSQAITLDEQARASAVAADEQQKGEAK